MIKLHPKKPDWFIVGLDIGEPLFGVPGVGFEDGNLICHRTHLVLLDHPDAFKYRETSSSSAETWAEREAWCLERGFKPRATQQQLLDFARYRTGLLLGDEQRLGKTLGSILCHHQWRQAFERNNKHKKYGPLVIVAPLSTRAVWMGWCKRVFPGESIGLFSGKDFRLEVLKNQIIFGHYDIIYKWQALFEIGTLILDEAHVLTNPKSRRSLTAALLASKAKHVIPMTGTPIYTFPPDLWSILNLVAPGAWGNYYEFATRYGAPESTSHGTKYTGVSNEIELKARLNEVMLRRLWKDCHSDLPPITRSVVVAEVSTAESNKLDLIAAALKSERSNTAGNLATYRKVVTNIKMTTVIKETIKVLERGLPVVVWCWHREAAAKITDKLIEAGQQAYLIHGEVPIAERDKRMTAWKESGTPAALVANMAVAGAGIDLSHARITIFAEIDYTPVMLGQAEMRTYAPDRPMDVIFVVANHPVDQRIVRALVSKLGASDPLGVGAAVDAIDALRSAVMGRQEEGDLDRLLEDLLASC